MNRSECTQYDKCSAPLCPLDKQTLMYGIWYPDEEICRKHHHRWVKTQKKIAKRARNKDHYYVLQMLKQDCVIGRAIDGLDPNYDESSQLGKWLKNHPPKKQLTEEEKGVLAERMRHLRRTRRVGG